jgi:hypothetical protein
MLEAVIPEISHDHYIYMPKLLQDHVSISCYVGRFLCECSRKRHDEMPKGRYVSSGASYKELGSHALGQPRTRPEHCATWNVDHFLLFFDIFRTLCSHNKSRCANTVLAQHSCISYTTSGNLSLCLFPLPSVRFHVCSFFSPHMKRILLIRSTYGRGTVWNSHW